MRGSGQPVWDDVTPPEDVAVLEEGTGGACDPTPDVLVVGGGIVGLAVGAFCTRAGMRVVVVERERLAHGASGRAGGGLAPDAHPELGEDWHALAKESLALHVSLDAEWGFGLRRADVVVGGARIPGQAHVNPLRLAAAFARHAGVVAPGTGCIRVGSRGSRVTSVETTRGPVRPGALVYATGTAPEPVASACRELVKGHLIATEPAPFDLDDIVGDGEIYVAQIAGGRLIGGGTKERDPSPEVDEDVVALIERRMEELVPGAGKPALTHAWTCFRPRPPDGRPVIDGIPGLDNAWVAAGFYSTGLLMAPVAGRLIASWVAGERPAELRPFAVRA